MTQNTDYQLLKSSSQLSKGRIGALRKSLEGNLEYTQHRDFTDHGWGHAEAVIENLVRLVPQLNEPLSEFEAFALLASAHLHDIGMAVANQANESAFDIRIDHFNRSKDFILSNDQALGLDAHEALAIGEICRAHGMPSLEYLSAESFSDVSIKGKGAVRIQFLAALLRLADLLDITYSRTPSLIFRNTRLNPVSQDHWNLHQRISDVKITNNPSWEIIVCCVPTDFIEEQNLYRLKNQIQEEIDRQIPFLRKEGIHFKRVDLDINQTALRISESKVHNPFLLLNSFDSRSANRFAGRNREIQELVDRVLNRKAVVVIGPSGVGKTSLVKAGLAPRLRKYNFSIINFVFSNDPKSSLQSSLKKELKLDDPPEILDGIKRLLDKRKNCEHLLIVGDHLEQLFTISRDESFYRDFVNEMGVLLGSDAPFSFLFCIREDYLPELYNLASDIPDLYDRANTVRIHALGEENAMQALQQASRFAHVNMSDELIERIVRDLQKEGEGTIYPPFLQIVGHRIYATWHSARNGGDQIPLSHYESMSGSSSGVGEIVNNYLDGLLDKYSQAEKPLVGEILGSMVTDHFTKKRVSIIDLKRKMPDCHNIESLIESLVRNRMVKKSLGQYELMHDFLAKRVVSFIDENRFLSPPVRKALEFIDQQYAENLTSKQIAAAADVTQDHLANLFRNQIGNGINKQLNKVRIGKAKGLLVRTREPLAEIAKQVGFKGQSSFSRKFREIESMSPIEYRKSYVSSSTAA